jgi:DNA-binding MarR family transcriptional regulator
VADQRLDDEQYRELLRFRVALRRFLRWSSAQAAEAGLTSQQHQLLLAIRGHAAADAPTIGELADHLLLRHHSVVELIDRTEQGGFVQRVIDVDDRRVVRLHLTTRGKRVLDKLSAQHLDELARLAPIVGRLARGLADDPPSDA